MERFVELRSFISVVEKGGFSAAARHMGESQPSVSKAVGALEKRLGVTLFHRSTRRVTLTSHGERYYERTKGLIAELEEADSEISSSTLDVAGLVRVAASATFGRLHVLPLVPELLSTSPGLMIDLVFSDSVRDMVVDRIDLAIRVGVVDDPDTVVRRIAVTPLVCAASPSYLKKHGKPKHPRDLVHHNCLVYGGMNESNHWPFVGPEGRFSVPVRGNLTSNSVETIRAGVLAGIGIGLMARVSLSDELRRRVVVPILEDHLRDVRHVSLVWPKRRFVPARVRHATEFFARALLERI